MHAITWNRIAATARDGDRETQRLSEVGRFMGFIGAGVGGCFSLIIQASLSGLEFHYRCWNYTFDGLYVKDFFSPFDIVKERC